MNQPNASKSALTRAVSARPWTEVLRRVGSQNLSLLLALAVLLAIFGALRPEIMFSYRNLINIALAVTVLGILALAQTAVIVSGGLDISVGSLVGLCTMCTALSINWFPADSGVGTAVSVVVGLLAGLLGGLLNGLIITHGRVNAFIATLGTMTAFRGVAFITSNGSSVPIVNDTLRFVGSGALLGIPVPIWLLAVTSVVFFVLLRSTVIGRNIYAIGGNPTVARLAGIDIKRYQLGIYAVSGLAAGLAGMILAARTMSGQPSSGTQGLELEVVTAAILGGCALSGGKGTIGGTLLGMLILGVLSNGMILTSVPTFYQLLAKGALLIVAVMMQEFHSRQAGSA